MKDKSPSLFTRCHCGLLRRAVRHVSQAYDAALAPSGLRATQLSLLEAVHQGEAGSSTMRELAEAMGMDRSTLGHNLRPLERDYLVSIGTDPSDARSRKVALTPKGRAKLAEGGALWRKMQSRFEKAFGVSATADLRLGLEALALTDLLSDF